MPFLIMSDVSDTTDGSELDARREVTSVLQAASLDVHFVGGRLRDSVVEDEQD